MGICNPCPWGSRRPPVGTALDLGCSAGIARNSLARFAILEAPGAASILDSVSGASATLAGGVGVVSDATQGKALSFPGGVGQATTIPGGGTAPLTLAAWVNPASVGGYQTLIGWSVKGGLQLRINPGGGMELLAEGNALIGTSNPGVVSAGTWHRVVATYDATGHFAFYVNGVAAGSGTNLQSLASGNLVLGENGDSLNETLGGLLDDVLIDGRAWSSDDVASDLSDEWSAFAGLQLTDIGGVSGLVVPDDGSHQNIGAGSFAGAVGSGPNYFGASGVLIENATVTISGGTFRGGDGVAAGGDGLWQTPPIFRSSAGPLTITGGTFVGGDFIGGLNWLPGVAGCAVVCQGSVTISGGTFTPGNGSVNGIVNERGRGLCCGSPGTTAVVSGGVWQGDFYFLPQSSTLRILGTGLSYVPAGKLFGGAAYGGRITGTLSDGNPIDVQIVVLSGISDDLLLNTPTEIRFGS